MYQNFKTAINPINKAVSVGKWKAEKTPKRLYMVLFEIQRDKHF